MTAKIKRHDLRQLLNMLDCENLGVHINEEGHLLFTLDKRVKGARPAAYVSKQKIVDMVNNWDASVTDLCFRIDDGILVAWPRVVEKEIENIVH